MDTAGVRTRESNKQGGTTKGNDLRESLAEIFTGVTVLKPLTNRAHVGQQSN